MTGPRNATTTRSGRFYDWHGERFWSVTTVIGCLDKPAIPWWAAERAAMFAIDNPDAVAALIATGQRAAAIDLIKKAPWRERDKAADIGTAVHKAVELYTLGQSMPVWADDVAGHMAQFEKFLNAYAPEFELAEATIYHRTHKWAGTTDGVCTFRKAPERHAHLVGKRTIIDYKTSNPNKKTGHGIYPEVGLQLNAYGHGEFVGMPDGSEEPLPMIEQGAAVWLRPDQWAVVPVRIGDDVYDAFRYVIEAFRWSEEISKTVLGEVA